MTNHVIDKRTWQNLITAVAAIGLLAACGGPEAPGEPVPDGGIDSVTIEGGAESVTIEVDEALPLDVQVAGDPENAVDWDIGEGDAFVDLEGNVVTGVEAGTAVVTATSRVDPSMSDGITVEVVAAGDGGTGDGGTGDGGDGGTGGDEPFEPVPDPTDPGTDIAEATSANSFALMESATGAGSFDVYAVAGEDATIPLVPHEAGVSAGDPIPLPGADTPWIVVTATGDSSTVLAEGTIDGFVYLAGDYEVYRSNDVNHAEEPIPGTLRFEMALAEDGDVVAVSPDLGTITLAGVRLAGPDAHLMIDQDVTLYGNGVTLAGGTTYESSDPGDEFTYNSRMIYVAPDAIAVLENLTITGGTFIYHGAGIMNEGNLTVRDSTITGNRAWHTGGGITTAEGSTLELVNVDLTGNDAYVNEGEVGVDYPIRGGEGSTGAIANGGHGGGLYVRSTATVTISGGSVAGNTAKVGGGGVYVEPGATVTMNGAPVSGNVAQEASDTDLVRDFTNYGGGILADGSLDYSGADIANNLTEGLGGGLYLSANGDAVLANVLFDANTAEYGGGIYHVVNDNLTPADPTAADDTVTFGTNEATAAASEDDYHTAAPAADGGSALRIDDWYAPRKGSKTY